MLVMLVLLSWLPATADGIPEEGLQCSNLGGETELVYTCTDDPQKAGEVSTRPNSRLIAAPVWRLLRHLWSSPVPSVGCWHYFWL